MSNNQGPHNAPGGTLPFIVAQFNDHQVAIRRNPDYAQTIASIQAAFEALESIPTKRIMLCANFPEFDGEIQIKEDLWGDLLPGLTRVMVRVPETGATTSSDGSSTNNLGSARNTESTSRVASATSMQIFCKTLIGHTLVVQVEPSDSVISLKQKIQQQLKAPAEQQRLIFSGKTLEDKQKLSYYSIQRGSTVHIVLRLRGNA